MLVMQDMVNSGKYSFLLDTVLPTINIKYKPDFFVSKKREKFFIQHSIDTINLLNNHPSVIYYTIFNEGWGQFKADKVYNILSQIDSSRIYDSTSGWFAKKLSDVDSKHIYFKKVKLKHNGKKPLILSEFGGYSYKILQNSFNQKNTYGYKMFNNEKDFEKAIINLYKTQIIPCIENGLNGAVLTQLSDVEDETNGLLTYDRKKLKIPQTTLKELSDLIYSSFYKQTQ